MNPRFRKTLLAGAIAALIAAPAFATSDTTKAGAQASTKTEAGKVEKQRSTPGHTTGQAMGQASQGAAASVRTPDNLIYSWSADALRGKEVVDQAGDKIGKVDNVLIAPDRGSVHAVISMGGLAGVGSREVLVSLDELRPVDDKVQISATKEQIEALPDYPLEPYAELKGEQPILGSLVERSASERGRGASGSTIAGMTQGADQPRTGRQMGAAKPDATARTGSVPPGTPRTSDPSSYSKDASKSGEATGMAARDRSTTERSETAALMTENPLYGRSAENLNGAKVVDRARNDVGKVEKVVLTPDHKSAFVVIDIGGGFLGLGKRSIVVPLDELEAVDDGLMMDATKESVEAHRDYSSEHYIELTGNRPISGAITEFSAFETDKDTSKPAGASAAPKRGQ